jgi:hypothetical protein
MRLKGRRPRGVVIVVVVLKLLVVFSGTGSDGGSDGDWRI